MTNSILKRLSTLKIETKLFTNSQYFFLRKKKPWECGIIKEEKSYLMDKEDLSEHRGDMFMNGDNNT